MKVKEKIEKAKAWAKENSHVTIGGVGFIIGTMTYHILEAHKLKAVTPKDAVFIRSDDEINITVHEKA